MTSVFDKFGIDHLSPSSLNKWCSTPRLWCLHYLLKIKDPESHAMSLGKAVEKGFEWFLKGVSFEKALETAQTEFLRLTEGELGDRYDHIEPMLRQCVEHAVDWPMELAASQIRVETWLDGVSIPVIGYVDFAFMNPLDLDLKTSKRCPGKPEPHHLRQVALYQKARQRPQALLYITDKRHAFYPVDDADLRRALDELTTIAQSLEKFLALMPDAESAAEALPHYEQYPKAKPRVADASGFEPMEVA
jgi:hypothetical protein